MLQHSATRLPLRGGSSSEFSGKIGEADSKQRTPAQLTARYYSIYFLETFSNVVHLNLYNRFDDTPPRQLGPRRPWLLLSFSARKCFTRNWRGLEQANARLRLR
jgi:hypothetical protein